MRSGDTWIIDAQHTDKNLKMRNPLWGVYHRPWFLAPMPDRTAKVQQVKPCRAQTSFKPIRICADFCLQSGFPNSTVAPMPSLEISEVNVFQVRNDHEHPLNE